MEHDGTLVGNSSTYRRNQPHRSEAGVDTPPTPNTLKRAEESLTMPHQPEESSSEAELRHRALEILRNPPKMNNDSTSSSSSETLDLRNERNVPMERAAHQRIRHSQIRETGQATVPDQGIVFDENNVPRDTKPEQKLKKIGRAHV